MPKFKTFRQMERILESQGFPKFAALVRKSEREDNILAEASLDQKEELFKREFGGKKDEDFETPERAEALAYAQAILGKDLAGE